MIAHWHGPKPLKGLECLVAAQAQDLDLDKACPRVLKMYRSVASWCWAAAAGPEGRSADYPARTSMCWVLLPSSAPQHIISKGDQHAAAL